MLTLQQILESDSISSLVAKLNVNFQTIAASNGGPQGIRGQQGIPGLPGKLGPTGPTGVTGPTGNIVGIIPFSAVQGTGPTAIGPSTTIITPFGEVGPWPQSSWQWLQYYHYTGSAGDIFIDHANDGYWQYLTSVDVFGASSAGYTQGGFYSYQGTGASYPYLGTTGGWAGAGWYFYPVPDASISSTVWVNDPTTYLISTGTGGYSGPYPQGPYQNSSPLTVNNARLVSKYGSIWVTSGSDSTNPSSFEDSDLTTSSIGKWGATAGILNYPNPGRLNSGIDRLLFKMSIDGLPYLTNVVARGYTGPLGPTATNAFPMSPPYLFPASSTGATPVGNQMIGESYWVKPSYGVSLENYTPLLFLSERKVDDPDSSLKFSSMGIYMFTQTDFPSAVNVDNSNNSLFLFTSRYSPDPTEMFFDYNNNITSNQTENWGEMILDFRRVIASNQYVCSLPADLRLSSDYRANPGSSARYEESNNDNVNTLNFAYRTYQGYISGINGKTLTGASTYADYWEYGLGDGTAGGPGGYTGGIHDASSGTAGMFTRKSWYGSSVLDIKPSEWENNSPDIETNNMVRVAGMMERGRRFTVAGATAHFMSELLFYTSQFTVDTANLADGVGVTNDVVSPTLNEHKSLPSLYVSPYRNIGIGTFVGNTNAANDLGPLEPAARFHVHAKENDRENDPTYTWVDLAAGSGASALLPTETFTVAAFSGDFGVANLQYNTDILIGNLNAQGSEYVNPSTGYGAGYGDVVNHMQDTSGLTGNNFLRNAIRTESWEYSYANTLRFGAQPGVAYGGSDPVKNPIGKTSVDSYKNEFQISLHPITKLSSATDLEDSNKSISGVGIHNLYPRTRLHAFGKNLYNETEFGQEVWTPGYVIAGGSASGVSGSYPFYGVNAQNSPSTNQVAIDYIGDSYRYPVGIYDYQYFVIGLTANTNSSLGGTIYSPNSAVYPNREVLSPTRTFAPWTSTLNNEAWPSTTLNVPINGSYRHGGTANAWWEPTSYVGFNLFRDISAADGTGGDNRDNTRWLLGTDGNNDYERGNNGGAAIIYSPHGELGIITIPSGRDGGYAYEQWEQRGLGTRDVLNQMKIVFDKNGNVALGNAAGWDLDAYPSQPLFSNGLIRYTPFAPGTKTTTPGTTAGAGNQYTSSYYNNGVGQGAYGLLVYTGYTETSSSSPAATINQFATEKEYIRLEVGAEKAWSRNGRSIIQNGYGYPASTTISIVNPDDYINFTTNITTINSWDITTDNEGRIVSSVVNYSGVGVTAGDFLAIVYPHPSEFNDPSGPQAYVGFLAPAGALAAEWSGMNQDGVHDSATVDLSTPGDAILINTIDERGDANLRLNNFVYGEGFGISGQGATGGALPGGQGNYTYDIVKEHRQKSPKLIFTFLEKNPETNRSGSLNEPYKKVNTVVQSAQNESPLREYFIPKTDNTGGTFMVFTDHMGSKEYSDGVDRQLTSGTGYTGGNGTGGTGAIGNINNLLLVEVVTAEVLYGHTGTLISGAAAKIDDWAKFKAGLSGGSLDVSDPKGIGYVQYFNRYSQNNGETGSLVNGVTNYFTSGQNGEFGFVGPYSSSIHTLGWSANYNAAQPIIGTGTTNALSYNRAPIKRNIDKYYKIYEGSRESYDRLMQADGWDSKATEIRFKRINSEFVFVDFNITISVENPLLRDSAAVIGSFNNLTNYIDCGVPRMTQALTFIYNPNEIEGRNGFTKDEFGNGPYFHMWSGYRNWLPGSAVVGDDLNRASVSYGNPVGRSGYVDSPSFQAGMLSQAQTWNGNFLEPGVFEFDPVVGSNTLRTSSILAQGSTGALGGNTMSNIRGEYANNIMNAQQSNALFYRALDPDDTLAYSFMYHLPTYRGIWGGQTMSRTKNFSWRMVPTVWETTNTTPLNWISADNNALKLEIMFNEPIMHVATKFNEEMFGETVTNPYKYLTLSGQGIIQYSDINRVNTNSVDPFA